VLTIIPIFIFLQTAELPAVVVLGMWFVIQFFNGLATVGRAEMGGVAWWAHIGGFIAGFLLIFPFRRR
jgi:rhomboid family protein